MLTCSVCSKVIPEPIPRGMLRALKKKGVAQCSRSCTYQLRAIAISSANRKRYTIGTSIGGLKITGEIPLVPGGKRRVTVKCLCGNVFSATPYVLAQRSSESKGFCKACYRKLPLIDYIPTALDLTLPGGHLHQEFLAWSKLLDESITDVELCWVHGQDPFLRFYNDMSDVPEGATLERVDEKERYGPTNCEWELPKKEELI